jgi:hypothetical protein
MAASPSFVGTPKTWQQALSAANTARDGTGTAPTLMTAGSLGSRVDRVSVAASGTTTAGVIRIFVNDGTNKYLRKEILVDPITPSTSIKVWEGEATLGIDLPTGWSLLISTHNAEAFKAFAHGGDY